MLQFVLLLCQKKNIQGNVPVTGKSLSEAFILTSTNPQYDKFTVFLCTNFQGQT